MLYRVNVTLRETGYQYVYVCSERFLSTLRDLTLSKDGIYACYSVEAIQ